MAGIVSKPPRKARSAPDNKRATAKAIHHRELMANFGLRAVQGHDVGDLIQGAATCVVEGLEVRRSKVLTYRRNKGDLLVAAGVGWDPGVVGHATLSAAMNSPQARVSKPDKPSLLSAFSMSHVCLFRFVACPWNSVSGQSAYRDQRLYTWCS
jgi:hypothetical protein